MYDLLDRLYFRNQEKNPRNAVKDAVNDHDLILDICTGTASNAINIAKNKRNTKLIGIDRSEEMLKIAKEKVELEKVSVSLLKMDATNLEFEDAYFDVVIISLVLHEIEPKIATKIINESKRVLKPDGKIIVMEWEVPKKIGQKVLFLPIHLFEPKMYRTFVRQDMKEYFKEYGLYVNKIWHCDYTKVIELVRLDER